MFTDAQNTALAVIVFVYFLFLVALAGIINRRVKTYEDYSVAGRTVTVFPMILTLIGTAIGGLILLGYMTNGFALGMGQIWLALVAVVPSILVVTVFAKPIRRIGEHHGMVPLGDFTALVYGEKARIPTRPVGAVRLLSDHRHAVRLHRAHPQPHHRPESDPGHPHQLGDADCQDRPRRAQSRRVPRRAARHPADRRHLRPLRRRHHRLRRLGHD